MTSISAFNEGKAVVEYGEFPSHPASITLDDLSTADTYSAWTENKVMLEDVQNERIIV